MVCQRLCSSSFAPQKYPIDSSKRLNLNRKVMIHIIQDIRQIATVEQPGFRGLIECSSSVEDVSVNAVVIQRN